jgi:hypothetical protein
MYDDILGKKQDVKISHKSEGSAAPRSFSEVWAEKQRQIRQMDDDKDEVEDLQMDSFEI